MCAMMQKLRVNSMAMKAPLSGCGCSRSIGMPPGLSDLTHSVKISSMPKLTISDVTHELVDLAITIGRGPDNTIVVNDQSISTHHAQLLLEGDTYRLKDLNSTNGTRVNSKLVTEAVLRFDDRIRFGDAEANRMTNLKCSASASEKFRHLTFVIPSSFVIRISSFFV